MRIECDARWHCVFCPDSALNYWFSYGFWGCWRSRSSSGHILLLAVLFCSIVVVITADTEYFVLLVFYTYILKQLCTFYIDVLSVCHEMLVRQEHSLPLKHYRYLDRYVVNIKFVTCACRSKQYTYLPFFIQQNILNITGTQYRAYLHASLWSWTVPACVVFQN